MARLIVLNGAPASGKSTLARRWVAEHPMALALDIDVIRAMLGGSLDEPERSGRAARRLAVGMARRHLGEGFDVIIPQFLAKEEFIVELARLAAEVGVEFVEIALIAPLVDLRQRLDSRAHDSDRVEVHDAAVLLARHDSPDPLGAMHAAMHALIDRRTLTRRIDVVDGDVDVTLGRLRSVLA